MLLPFRLGQNWPHVEWWGTGPLGVALWDGGESELELRGLGRGQGGKTPGGITEERSEHTEGLLFLESFNCPLSSHRLSSLLLTVQDAVAQA